MNQKTNGFEIAALVLGIVSIPLSCLHATLGIIAAVVGIVMAVKAKKCGGAAIQQPDLYARLSAVLSAY